MAVAGSDAAKLPLWQVVVVDIAGNPCERASGQPSVLSKGQTWTRSTCSDGPGCWVFRGLKADGQYRAIGEYELKIRFSSLPQATVGISRRPGPAIKVIAAAEALEKDVIVGDKAFMLVLTLRDGLNNLADPTSVSDRTVVISIKTDGGAPIDALQLHSAGRASEQGVLKVPFPSSDCPIRYDHIMMMVVVAWRL